MASKFLYRCCYRLYLAAAIAFNVAGIGSAIASDEHSLSALEAQGASRRFDTDLGFIDSSDADELSWGFQYTSVIREKHQLTAALPLVDPDVAGRIALRSGDLALGYSYSFKQTISANPWVPSNIGTGIGLSLPTGDLDTGTGNGSYVLAPRLGYVATIGRSFALLPSLEYRRSFAAENGAQDIKTLGATVPLFYVNPHAFWINVSPIYLQDLSHHQGAFGLSVLVGKLLIKNLALSLAYARLPEFMPGAGGNIETIRHNSLTLGVHLPFSYPE